MTIYDCMYIFIYIIIIYIYIYIHTHMYIHKNNTCTVQIIYIYVYIYRNMRIEWQRYWRLRQKPQTPQIGGSFFHEQHESIMFTHIWLHIELHLALNWCETDFKHWILWHKNFLHLFQHSHKQIWCDKLPKVSKCKEIDRDWTPLTMTDLLKPMKKYLPKPQSPAEHQGTT